MLNLSVIFILHKFVQKIKIFCLRWNLASRLIRKCWIRCRCSRYLFWLKSTRFGQIWFKKTCLFYGTVYFPVLDKYTFLGKFIPKYQNYNFQPRYVMFTKWNGFLEKVDLTWSTFKICQIFLLFFINRKRSLKQFIRLIASIYQ